MENKEDNPLEKKERLKGKKKKGKVKVKEDRGLGKEAEIKDTTRERIREGSRASEGQKKAMKECYGLSKDFVRTSCRRSIWEDFKGKLKYCFGGYMIPDSPDAGFKPSGEEEKKDAKDPGNENSEGPSTEEPRINQVKNDNINSTNNINTSSDGNSTNNVNVVSSTVNAAGIKVNAVDPK
ncbi:hypothetical protein Tco_0802225 [Tanacetum coccineum]|uniref:Uncharacterized protein n=1 Tax=Tanacetum coccineum TaxID=301880 RepID=A0ABQ5A1U8_9ASTR